MSFDPFLGLAIRAEGDVVLARQQARQVAGLLGFEAQDQTRIATAVSEIARNAVRYAVGGKAEFAIEGVTPPQVLVVRISDRGPGIQDLQRILEGEYQSTTGMGLGLIGARRLMDGFSIESEPGQGTVVVLRKLLSPRARLIGSRELSAIATEIARNRERDPFAELQRQNQELLAALEELSRRQEELVALNRELEDTNRGVVALYAELDERADHLRRADEVKSRFLSNMSHEFRTPVNSIQALARMLLERADGELTVEQERQVTFIRKAAEGLSELVNDLLDLAKVEAGKTSVRPVDFEVTALFGALRGMLRPLLVNESVNLVFEEPVDVPPLHTDEAKVSQIVRNFVSNALKFTERGEVRVAAGVESDGKTVRIRVSDTGIGIAEEDRERIFQEFAQVDSPLQRRVRGTGLGLPLCRKLAELLGGAVEVESRLGIGSTFTLVIPRIYGPAVGPTAWELDPKRIPVLVVDDEPEMIHLYDRHLVSAGFQMLAARSTREARDALATFRPRAIVLDIMLQGEDSWALLAEVERSQELRDVPVIVLTNVEDERKAIGLGAEAFLRKPIDGARLVRALVDLCAPETVRRILIVDDEEIFRYVLRQHLTTPTHLVSEAATAADALVQARSGRTDVICLDLNMPDGTGFDVLDRLKSDPETRDIPVLIVTGTPLDEAARSRLERQASALLGKDSVSRESMLAAVERALAERERRVDA